jgi:hypothetical protein
VGDLAVIVPSRGRPHNIARLIDAMNRTCRADTTLIVGVDRDDPHFSEYQGFRECEIVTAGGLKGRLVAWLNLLASARTKDYACIGHIGDDNVPRTIGWDARIIESLQSHCFCFGDDLDPGRAPGSLTIHAFMRSSVIERLGYMGPPSLRHMYVDPVWMAWGTATSIEFLPDVVLEHMHYTVGGKAPVDESYEASTGLIPRDCAAYNEYCYENLNHDIRKLGGKPFTRAELEEFNRALNIPRAWGRAA